MRHQIRARVPEGFGLALGGLVTGGTGWEVTVKDGDVRLHSGTGGLSDRVAEVIAQTVSGVSRVTIDPA